MRLNLRVADGVDDVHPLDHFAKYGIGGAVGYYRKCKSMGADAYLAGQQKPLSEKARLQRAKTAEPAVRKVIEALDQKGRWVSGETITCQGFVRNFTTLCEYLTAAQPQASR